MQPTPPINTTILYHYSPDHASGWLYPPAINSTFLWDWYTTHVRGANGSAYQGPKPDDEFAVWAIRELPRVKNGEFGSQDVVVHVGDVLEMAWRDTNGREDASEGKNRSITVNCVVCSTGLSGTGSSGVGDIPPYFEACGNWKESSHISPFMDIILQQPQSTPYTIPPLSHSFNLPEESVGVCYLSLSSPQDYFDYDYSTPFPVIQKSRETGPFRFSKDSPAGIEIRRRGLSTGGIVGIVVGVFAALVILGSVAWWVRRRKQRGRKKGKGVDEVGVEMQRVQIGGVERRVERDKEGEVPPAYHEIMREGGVQDAARRNG